MPPRRAPKRLASAVIKEPVEKKEPVGKRTKKGAPEKKPAPKKADLPEAKDQEEPEVKNVAEAMEVAVAAPTDVARTEPEKKPARAPRGKKAEPEVKNVDVAPAEPEKKTARAPRGKKAEPEVKKVEAAGDATADVAPTEPEKNPVNVSKEKEVVPDAVPTEHVPTDVTPIDLLSYLTEKTWKDALAEEFTKPYFKELENKLSAEYAAGKQIFPPRGLIFNAYNLSPLNQIKVVILGQDPYHDDRQAHGLAFSVPHGVHPLPPSLKNMFTELEDDDEITGFHPPPHGCLTAWTEEGVFLLNTSLTVEAHKANSHSKLGWQQFTDATIKAISDNTRHVVFLLLGNFAQKKETLIDQGKHYVIKEAHPSPLSVTKFKKCRCFSQVNHALKVYGREPVDWTLEHLLD